MHLTNDRDFKACSVLHVLNLQHQLIFSRVVSLCRANEEDAVHIGVTDVNHLGVDGLTILVPGCNRARFALLGGGRIH